MGGESMGEAAGYENIGEVSSHLAGVGCAGRAPFPPLPLEAP